MTSITLEHVSKAFEAPFGSDKPIPAVQNVSLKVTSGDILGILGPSGCGKSTLLRLIAGLHAPDSGRVLYDDVDLKDVPLRERGVGMVFQEGALIPHWESRKSVGFFLSLRKRDVEIPEKLKRISKITGIGLNQLLERKPRQLSGGEQQRVSIARALARDLKILLFDEPFSNLDAKYRHEARVELKRLLNEFPVTSVYVTHDQVEAVALSHRIAIMREGQIEQVGTYHQLYTSPHNLFVATFLGQQPINLFQGFVIDAHWRGVNFAGFPMRRDLEEGSKVTLGIRPEHVRLDEGGVECKVDEVVPYLAERYQHVTVHAPGERFTLHVPLDHPVKRGDTLRCSLDPDEILLFDASAGTRIG